MTDSLGDTLMILVATGTVGGLTYWAVSVWSVYRKKKLIRRINFNMKYRGYMQGNEPTAYRPVPDKEWNMGQRVQDDV